MIPLKYIAIFLTVLTAMSSNTGAIEIVDDPNEEALAKQKREGLCPKAPSVGGKSMRTEKTLGELLNSAKKIRVHLRSQTTLAGKEFQPAWADTQKELQRILLLKPDGGTLYRYAPWANAILRKNIIASIEYDNKAMGELEIGGPHLCFQDADGVHWWARLSDLQLFSPVLAASDETELFAGGDLKGWVEEQHGFFKKKHPNASTWSVKNGIATCDGTLGNCGFLRFDKKLTDFTLRLEYRMGKNCNSGVCIRCAVPYDGRPDETLPSRVGYEIQIMDDAGVPASKTSTGSFYGKLAPLLNAAKPVGEWNAMEIVCHGPKIRVTLNGKIVQDVDQTEIEAIRDRPRAGFIALQNHGHSTEFRNLRLREIKEGK